MKYNEPPFIRYNAHSDPCDVLVGPCACGAWHSKEEWDYLVFLKKIKEETTSWSDNKRNSAQHLFAKKNT